MGTKTKWVVLGPQDLGSRTINLQPEARSSKQGWRDGCHFHVAATMGGLSKLWSLFGFPKLGPVL